MLRRLLFVFCFGGGNLVNEMDRHREVLAAFVLDGHASGHITAVGHDAVNVEGGIVGDEWTIGGSSCVPQADSGHGGVSLLVVSVVLRRNYYFSSSFIELLKFECVYG